MLLETFYMSKGIWAVCFLFIFQTSQAQPLTEIARGRIDSLLQYIYNPSLPGAVVCILQNNKCVFDDGYGVRSLQTNEKNTVTTNFNIASLTKQFTALAILQLAEQHKLSTTNKLSRFFPDMNKQVADAVTVQQLLTHTSGIVDHYSFTNTTHLAHAHNIDVYNAIKNVDSLYFTPGTQFRYSNTGFCLLALIIEKVSGMSYNSYLQKNLFTKANMLHTTIWNEKASLSEAATGYDWDSATQHFIPSGASEHIFFSTEGDGGIYTSVHDYRLWLKALNEEKIFSKHIVEQARSLQYAIDAKRRLGYGFGWFVDESEDDKKVYHSGDNGGFRTYSFTIPEQGFAIVIFSNRSDVNVEEVVEKIYHILYPSDKPFVKIEVMTS